MASLDLIHQKLAETAAQLSKKDRKIYGLDTPENIASLAEQAYIATLQVAPKSENSAEVAAKIAKTVPKIVSDDGPQSVPLTRQQVKSLEEIIKKDVLDAAMQLIKKNKNFTLQDLLMSRMNIVLSHTVHKFKPLTQQQVLDSKLYADIYDRLVEFGRGKISKTTEHRIAEIAKSSHTAKRIELMKAASALPNKRHELYQFAKDLGWSAGYTKVSSGELKEFIGKTVGGNIVPVIKQAQKIVRGHRLNLPSISVAQVVHPAKLNTFIDRYSYAAYEYLLAKARAIDKDIPDIVTDKLKAKYPNIPIHTLHSYAPRDDISKQVTQLLAFIDGQLLSSQYGTTAGHKLAKTYVFASKMNELKTIVDDPYKYLTDNQVRVGPYEFVAGFKPLPKKQAPADQLDKLRRIMDSYDAVLKQKFGDYRKINPSDIGSASNPQDIAKIIRIQILKSGQLIPANADKDANKLADYMLQINKNFKDVSDSLLNDTDEWIKTALPKEISDVYTSIYQQQLFPQQYQQQQQVQAQTVRYEPKDFPLEHNHSLKHLNSAVEKISRSLDQEIGKIYGKQVNINYLVKKADPKTEYADKKVGFALGQFTVGKLNAIKILLAIKYGLVQPLKKDDYRDTPKLDQLLEDVDKIQDKKLDGEIKDIIYNPTAYTQIMYPQAQTQAQTATVLNSMKDAYEYLTDELKKQRGITTKGDILSLSDLAKYLYDKGQIKMMNIDDTVYRWGALIMMDMVLEPTIQVPNKSQATNQAMIDVMVNSADYHAAHTTVMGSLSNTLDRNLGDFVTEYEAVAPSSPPSSPSAPTTPSSPPSSPSAQQPTIAPAVPSAQQPSTQPPPSAQQPSTQQPPQTNP